MDLDLDILDLRGRRERALTAEIVRPLTEADLALLSVERGIQPTAIKRLTDSHHALARCLAEGLSHVEASAITGYTPSRISVLQNSPLFEELVAHYRANKDAALADLHERMLAVGLTAVEELKTRLEEEPEKIGTPTLIEALKTLADRTGHGPSSKTTNVNLNLSLAARVAEGRRRAMSAQISLPESDVLGAESVTAEPTPPLSEDAA